MKHFTRAKWENLERRIACIIKQDVYDSKYIHSGIHGTGWMLQEKVHGWIMNRLLFPLDLTPGLERAELALISVVKWRQPNPWPLVTVLTSPRGLEEKRKTEHRERITRSGQKKKRNENWRGSCSRPRPKWCFFSRIVHHSFMAAEQPLASW